MLSIVIPTYNRAHNLNLCLTALTLQSTLDFTVIIADDGSTDHTRNIVFDDWPFSIRYLWKKHNCFGTAIMRNMGAAVVEKGTTAVLFLDSDVLLNKNAIAAYQDLHKKYPEAVVVGRYDWLPPMRITKNDVLQRWDDVINAKLPTSQAKGGIVGPDPRAADNLFTEQLWQGKYACKIFSGNLLIPVAIFRQVGGFDENIIRHGGQDAELSIRLQLMNAQVIFSQQVVGYHVYHEVNQEQRETSLRINMGYIAQKHDLPALGLRVNWEGGRIEYA